MGYIGSVDATSVDATRASAVNEKKTKTRWRMPVKLINSGNWCEEGCGPLVYFKVGDIYNGPDQEKLVKVGWAEKIVQDKAYKHLHAALCQDVTLAFFAPVCDEEFFQTVDGDPIPDDKLSLGEPIDTKHYSSGVYFGFSAPGLPPGGSRVFKILHSDDIDGGYEPVSVENLVYAKSDGRFPIIFNPAKSSKSIDEQGIPLVREGVVGTRRYVKVGMWAGGEYGGSAIATVTGSPNKIPLPDNRECNKHILDHVEALGVPVDILMAGGNDEPIKDSHGEDKFDTVRAVIEKIIADAPSDKEAKANVASYAKGAFGFTVDRRKGLEQLIADILDNVPADGNENAD